MNISINLPAAFKGLLEPMRYKVYYGGRGSAKSWSFATALVMRALSKPTRILCTREQQNSINDSVRALLVDTIERMGVGESFDCYRDELRTNNGSLFSFEGLKYNTKRIKSLEGYDIAWVEEGDAVSRNSWNILLPTIRKKDSEIWVSFNRDLADDPVYQLFVENPRPNSIVKQVLFSDNPWCPVELKELAEYDRVTDPERFAHVWLGEAWGRSDAVVFSGKYRIKEFDAPKDTIFYCGADWGFSHDPLAAIRCYVDTENNYLYIDSESYGFHIEVPETGPLLDSILPARNWPCRADSARPELISYLNNIGYNIIPAKKGAGSVEEGIRNILGFKEIIVHPVANILFMN
jgi:phage terminase large subunit